MTKKKILLVEIILFIFYFFILDILTRLQLNISGVQKNNVGEGLIYGLVYFPLNFLYFFFYQFHIKNLLLKKKYSLFVIALILFIGLLEFALPLMDLLVSKATFIPAGVRLIAESNLKNPALFPRQMISLTLIHILMLSGLAFLIKTLNDDINIRKLKEQQLRLELDQLKAQLQPHFFFNTLNNIYSLALHNSAHTASTVALLAGLMRYIIYDCDNQQVPICKEVSFIEDYIKLEQIRHTDNTQISFETQGNMKEISIEPLLFLPLVENAFKHGINATVGKSWVSAVLIVFDNEIVFEIKNSIPADNPGEQQNGIGIQNLRKRLELLYPHKHDFIINKSTEYFEAHLNLYLK